MSYSFDATTAIEMGYFPETASSAISGALTAVIVMIQFANEISNAFSYVPPTNIIVRVSFETGQTAFTDLFTCFKVEDLPEWDFDAKTRFFHSSGSSSL